MTEALHSVALSADVGSSSSALLQAAWGVFCLGTSTKVKWSSLPMLQKRISKHVSEARWAGLLSGDKESAQLTRRQDV